MVKKYIVENLKSFASPILFSFYFAIIYTAPIYKFLLFPEVKDIVDSTVFLLLATSTAALFSVSVILLSHYHRSMEIIRTTWNEIVIYMISYIPVVILTSIPVGIAVNYGFPADRVAIIHHIAIHSIVVTGLYLRRRGRIQYPSWVQITEWGRWDYVALFGLVFIFTRGSLTSVFGPTGLTSSIFSLSCAVAAVLLRFIESNHTDNIQSTAKHRDSHHGSTD